MKNLTHFSIDNSLLKLRQRLGKSGAFTYDNLDELESHIRIGYDLNRKDHDDREAYEMSLESLGDPKELTEAYYHSNQKSIWRNYFWIICISMFIWMVIFNLFSWVHTFSSIYLVRYLPTSGVGFFMTGFNVGLSVLFLYTLLRFKNVAFELYKKVVPILVQKPFYIALGVFFLLLPYALRMLFVSLINFGPISPVNHTWIIFIWQSCLYLSPLFLLMKELLVYKKIAQEKLELRLAHRLKICVLSGSFLVILVNLSNILISNGSLLLMKYIKLAWSIEVLSNISLLLFCFFWIGCILFFYILPEKLIPSLYDKLNKHKLSRALYTGLFLFVVIPLCAGIMILQSQMLSLEELRDASINQSIVLKIIVLNTFLALCLLWSYRRIRNRKIIAWH